MKKILLLVLIASGCSKGSPDIPHQIDSDLQPYIASFKAAADAHSVEYGDLDNITVMRFDTLPGEDLGDCHIHTVTKNGSQIAYYKEIVIDKDFKTLGSEIYKQKVFLHEIGHCAYHMSTSNDYNSMMYSPMHDDNQEEFEKQKDDFFNAALQNKANWLSTDDLQ